MAKTLQDRIQKIQPYFRGIEVKETLFIVRVVYPNKWSAYNRSDDNIKAAKSDDTSENEWFYYASVNDVDLGEMFDLVEDTIATNQELYQKIELMRVRMEELKDLFQNESLEKLKTLEFTFGKVTNKTKRKTRKNKQQETDSDKKDDINTESVEEQPIQEEIRDNNNLILSNEEANKLAEGW